MDLAQILDRRRLVAVLCDVLRRRVVTAEQVLAAAEAFGGRAGIALLREALFEVSPGYESILEAEAGGHFAAAGLDLVPQYEVMDGWWLVARLDFADPERRLGVEIDGRSAHLGDEAVIRDRRRDRRLRELGWTILRYGVEDVQRHYRRMVEQVMRVQAQLPLVASAASRGFSRSG